MKRKTPFTSQKYESNQCDSPLQQCDFTKYESNQVATLITRALQLSGGFNPESLPAHNIHQNGAHWSLQRPWVFNAAAPFFSNTRSQLSTFSSTQHIQSSGSSTHPLFQKLGLGHAVAHAISNACNECTGRREEQRADWRWAGSLK